MRLLLPLLCGVIAATAVVLPSRAEGDNFVVKSIVVEPVALDTRVFKPVAAQALPVSPEKQVVALSVPAAVQAEAPAPGVQRDRQREESLRGSVLMLLIPNLCCR
jgi:hypothetical protein